MLGRIIGSLAAAHRITQTFVSALRYLAVLPGGELYLDSDLELDTDGWPGGAQTGEETWNADTSLHTQDRQPIDANSVPYIVLPLPTGWSQQFGVSMGDYAAVIFRDRLCFAVFADLGPKNRIGEGSLALLRALGAERLRPDGTVINAGMGPGVITIVFPGSEIAPTAATRRRCLKASRRSGGSGWSRSYDGREIPHHNRFGRHFGGAAAGRGRRFAAVSPRPAVLAAGAGFTFQGKPKSVNKTRQSASGIACSQPAAAPGVCLVVFDEGVEARYLVLNGDVLTTDAERVVLLDKDGELDAEGAAVDDTHYYVTGSHAAKRKSCDNNPDSRHVLRFDVDPASGRVKRGSDGKLAGRKEDDLWG